MRKFNAIVKAKNVSVVTATIGKSRSAIIVVLWRLNTITKNVVLQRAKAIKQYNHIDNLHILSKNLMYLTAMA